MKFLVTLTSSILIAAAILSVVPCFGESEIYNNTLRLHVIAQSDSAKDQALKLGVRDAVLEAVSGSLQDCTSFEDAYVTVADMTDTIKSAAEEYLLENGSEHSVKVELGRENYPRRDYGETSLPAGEYTSLRVIIGEGEGKNWWCVLFPSVCMGFAKDADEYAAVGFTPREYKIITGESGRWKVRFRVLEILSDVIGFDYK
jgi:stage II sporulation protein R